MLHLTATKGRNRTQHSKNMDVWYGHYMVKPNELRDT